MAKSKKKEQKTRISFRSGIKKLHEQMGNELKITAKCVGLISTILNSICSRLVESTRKESKSDKMDANDVNKAMKKTFPVTLSNHAAAEGSKTIGKFRGGLIYKPPSAKPKKRVLKRGKKSVVKRCKKSVVKRRKKSVVKRRKKSVVKRRKKSVVKRRIKKKTVKKKPRKKTNRAKELLLRRLPVKKITVVELPRSRGTVKVKPHSRRMPSRYRRIDLKKQQKIIKKPQKKVRKIRKVSVKTYTRMLPARYKNLAPKKRVTRKKRVARKKIVRRKKVIRKKKTEGTIRFTRGLTALLGQIHPGVKITPKAMKLINSAMQDLCTNLIATSQAYATRSEVTDQNVTTAVRSVLPPTMANHAAAEESKAIACHAAKVSKAV